MREINGDTISRAQADSLRDGVTFRESLAALGVDVEALQLESELCAAVYTEAGLDYAEAIHSAFRVAFELGVRSAELRAEASLPVSLAELRLLHRYRSEWPTLQAALEFYADPATWEFDSPRSVRPSSLDKGERARKALEAVEALSGHESAVKS